MTRLSPRNLAAGIASVPLERFVVAAGGKGPGAGREGPVSDPVAVEEPLELRLAGEPWATIMRTPGSDRELAVGYLLSEGIIGSVSDLGSLAHCRSAADWARATEAQRTEVAGNVLNATAAPGTAFALDEPSAQRTSVVSSACGVCGRRSVDELLQRIEPCLDPIQFSAEWVAPLTERLACGQDNFRHTGGVHAAAYFRPDSPEGPVAVYEDVGRHNAVDKVVGALALRGKLPAHGGALVVSGRLGFEIAQKAAVAGFPLLVSVSAPTSLAIEAARRGGLTLVSFSRGGRFNVYCGGERIV